VYIETIPRKGYRFRVPVAVHAPGSSSRDGRANSTTMRLQKILWTNIAELKVADARRQRYTRLGFGFLVALVAVLATLLILRK
jgi:hypothetical protein